MDHLDRVEPTAFIEVFAQCAAPHEFHHDRLAGSNLTGVEDGDDRWVNQSGGGDRLGMEPRAQRGIAGHMAMQDLHGDGSTEDFVIGAPHLSHTTAGEVEPESIAVAEECADRHGAGHRVTRSLVWFTRAGSTCR